MLINDHAFVPLVLMWMVKFVGKAAKGVKKE